MLTVDGVFFPLKWIYSVSSDSRHAATRNLILLYLLFYHERISEVSKPVSYVIRMKLDKKIGVTIMPSS